MKLYGLLYYGVFAAVILAVVLRVTTIWMLLVVLLFPLVQKNIKTFQANPDKATTFAIAIKNLVLIHGVQIVALVLALVFS